MLQTAARAVDCGKPTLGAISFSPDVTGHGILSFGWGFPSADHSNWLQFRIDGALGYAFSVSAQSGTYSAPFSVTCWPTGPHLIEVRAVSCSGWDDPQYETWQSDAITAIQNAERALEKPATLTGRFQGSAWVFETSLATQPYLIAAAIIASATIIADVHRIVRPPGEG